MSLDIVIECKVLRDSNRQSIEGTIERGVEQTFGYMAKCRVEEGHLVIFDRYANKQPGRSDRTADPDECQREVGSVAIWLL